jgi:hypothetical protein
VESEAAPTLTWANEIEATNTMIAEKINLGFNLFFIV